jgi:pimeloyl-ACP methyl ester carboxylesterase
MIAVAALLPEGAPDRAPIILVHGAANSAAVWTFWQWELAARGWPTYALDLRGHGRSDPIDLSQTGMQDYAADVDSLVGQLGQRPVLIGWSMGGLVAMMVAATGLARACVSLAPSRPAQRIDESVALRSGQFGPEEYGITGRDPEQQRAMPDLDHEERMVALASLGQESRLARDERRRGIVIERLPCPLLVVTGTLDRQWPRERYTDLWLEADFLEVEGASHWGLVLNRRALDQAIPAVLEWIERVG